MDKLLQDSKAFDQDVTVFIVSQDKSYIAVAHPVSASMKIKLWQAYIIILIAVVPTLWKKIMLQQAKMEICSV